jgi:formylglycine-generating enzyme required for sulfatase activity
MKQAPILWLLTVLSSPATTPAATTPHGGSRESVADELPQHSVSLRSLALGKHDVTRGEYGAFARETGYPAGDGCGHDSFKWNKQAKVRGRVSASDDGPYRLPSESEWEYGARAGAATRYRDIIMGFRVARRLP